MFLFIQLISDRWVSSVDLTVAFCIGFCRKLTTKFDWWDSFEEITRDAADTRSISLVIGVFIRVALMDKKSIQAHLAVPKN